MQHNRLAKHLLIAACLVAVLGGPPATARAQTWNGGGTNIDLDSAKTWVNMPRNRSDARRP